MGVFRSKVGVAKICSAPPSRFWNAIWPRRMREGLYMDNNYIVNIYAILSMV